MVARTPSCAGLLDRRRETGASHGARHGLGGQRPPRSGQGSLSEVPALSLLPMLGLTWPLRTVRPDHAESTSPPGRAPDVTRLVLPRLFDIRTPAPSLAPTDARREASSRQTFATAIAGVGELREEHTKEGRR